MLKSSLQAPRTLVISLGFLLLFIWVGSQQYGRHLNAIPHTSASDVQLQKELGARPRIKLSEAASGNLIDVQNSTLGFQKIFVLSLPGRSDKRDALILSAYLSGLEIEFIDGVNGTLVSEKALPQNGAMRNDAKTLGCWRGHMDIFQKMVRERIHTALIMEDDVDWDVMIKAQMTEFARGTRALQKSTWPMHSPYGDGWDLLNTGHCGHTGDVKVDQDYWITENDPTVVIPEQRSRDWRPNLTPPSLSGNRSRVVFAEIGFYCLASYAVSIDGAARILYDQAIMPYARGIDSGMHRMCGRREYGNNKCLGAQPTIMGVHHPAGDMSRDSDRVGVNEGKVRKDPETLDVIYSVRLNLGGLLKGETIVKAQFPEFAAFPEIDASELKLPNGKLIHVKKEEYIIEKKDN